MTIIINTQEEFDELRNKNGDVYLEEDLILKCNIDARNIDVYNIDAHNINARNIIAHNIEYYATCFAIEDISCESIKGILKDSKHSCLNGFLTIFEDEDRKERIESDIKDLEDKLKQLREELYE